MKRDMDLVREILLQIEAAPADASMIDIQAEGFSDPEIQYHLKLLYDAGYIEAIDASTVAGDAYLPEALTWDGHEFLDAARDSGRWLKAKNIAEKAGGLTIDVMKAVLTDLAKKAVLGE